MTDTQRKIKFESERYRYTIRAYNDRFAIMTKPFNLANTYLYTITDLKRNVRGPCDLIFGPNSDLNTAEGAAEALQMLENGEMSVSYRRYVPLLPTEIAQLIIGDSHD
jgi:hypothetical protein